MSIITVSANATMCQFHDRMPTILQPSEYDEWLDRAEVERAPMHLLRPYTGSDIVVHEAHAKVGNVRNVGQRPSELCSVGEFLS